jgi:ankyrin repeat protein
MIGNVGLLTSTLKLELLHASAESHVTTARITCVHRQPYVGDLAQVQRRLIQGADPDSTDAQGCTGVHHAAAAGHSAVLDALSAAKANAEARNHNMETPLLYAAKRGCHAGLTWLLDHHASVNALDKGRRGAAVAALVARSIPCLTLLLGYGASAHQHDEQWGWCPLHWASHIGDAPAVALLLDKRASPYALSKAGLTPLAVAAAAKHTAVVALLSSQEAAAPAHCVWRAEQGTKSRSSTSSGSSSVIEACGEVWIGSAAAAKPAWASDREFGAILSINDTSSSRRVAYTQPRLALRGRLHSSAPTCSVTSGACQHSTGQLARAEHALRPSYSLSGRCFA